MSHLAALSHLGIVPAEGGVRLGMPHLSPSGLSETWLLKHLGDVHWQMLARQIGRPAAQVADREGSRVYAAFRQVRIEEARFGAAREDERLSLASRLWRLSRTQLLSRHLLEIDGRAAGTVTLVSCFVRRDGHSNRRVSRVDVPGLDGLEAWPGARPEPATPMIDHGEAARFTFTPCAGEDFNGAGFLYFSSYVSIAERAAFALDPGRAAVARTVERTVTYHGNMDAGDGVEVVTQVRPAAPGHWRLDAQLRRTMDGALLAEIATVKLLGTL